MSDHKYHLNVGTVKGGKKWGLTNYCSVPQCGKYGGTLGQKGKRISTHHFPKNLKLQNEWKRRLKISKKITSGMLVCSEHFTDEDFMGQRCGSGTKEVISLHKQILFNRCTGKNMNILQNISSSHGNKTIQGKNGFSEPQLHSIFLEPNENEEQDEKISNEIKTEILEEEQEQEHGEEEKSSEVKKRRKLLLKKIPVKVTISTQTSLSGTDIKKLTMELYNAKKKIEFLQEMLRNSP